MTRGHAIVIWDCLRVTAVCMALALALFGRAAASDGQTIADVRCVVVGIRMIEMTAPQQRAAGMMLAVYYLGRLDAGSQYAHTDRLIEQEARKMTSTEFRADAVRCGEALQSKGAEIQRIDAIVHGQDGAIKK